MRIAFLFLALVGPLLYGGISGGVTVRKIGWGLLGLALLGMAAFFGLLLAFGYEAHSTGVNPSYWGWVVTLVLLPLLGYVYSLGKLFRLPRPEKQDATPEV